MVRGEPGWVSFASGRGPPQPRVSRGFWVTVCCAHGGDLRERKNPLWSGVRVFPEGEGCSGLSDGSLRPRPTLCCTVNVFPRLNVFPRGLFFADFGGSVRAKTVGVLNEEAM